MRFPPSFIDEIKARLPVSQVVGRRVKLKKEGREWRGLSPFTAEKTPSFYVNDSKARWFDFSAGRNGNIFDFVMETEGLSFPEAVEKLAGDAGLALPKMTQEEVVREARRATALEAAELAARFFEARLQGADGARARGYLADRGIGPALQKEFRIGYAPRERYQLRDHLAGKGVDVETMIEAGLLVTGEGIAVPYEHLRDRVTFPIADGSGRVIAFGGRAMDKDNPAKYKNSPESALFHKSFCLYNHHKARLAAHKANRVIAVEGYVDVIAMHAAGFPETVAPLGTALTADQCGLLWRMAEEPILCFDGDRAGRKAAFRAIETALPLIAPGRSLRFAFLPEGQDPDDLYRSAGSAAVAEVVESARPLADVLWMREFEAQTLDTPERRAAFERRVREATRVISDETLRRHYQDEMNGRLAALFGRESGGQRPARRPWTPGGGRFQREPASLSSPVSVSPALAQSSLFKGGGQTISPREALILLVFLNHPDFIGDEAETLAATEFSTPLARRLRDFLLAAGDDHLTGAGLRAAAAEAGLEPALAALAQQTGVSALACVQPDAPPFDAAEALKQALALHRRTRALHRELALAEEALAADPSEVNLARLQDIQAQLTALDGAEATVEGFGQSAAPTARRL
ncbi:MAG: DNA primase [Hyphomicrobiales bacterium]|nr:DNA primase [Hyphomicrobiales bacterium]